MSYKDFQQKVYSYLIKYKKENLKIIDKVLHCYKKYMEFVVDKAPSYKQFVNNMQEKMEDAEFTNDMQSLLRPGISFNASDAYPLIYEAFIDRMEGKRE